MNPRNAALEPGFFDGRLMIDILHWDWNRRLRFGESAKTRPQARFQGLDYGRDLIIRGQIRAPRELRGRTIKVILSPFGPKVRFGRGALLHVGALKTSPEGANFDFEASLMLPEDAIAPTITSLASTWKHLQIQSGDDDLHAARIFAYSFHADVPPNFEAWANAD